jgi:serine phosphatase RsbU (regulator of sigma subunit)
MSDLLNSAIRESTAAKWDGLRDRITGRLLLRKEVALNGPAWLPLVLVLGAIAVVAYADHSVVSISLVYLYILPLSVGAIFLRRKISYGLIAVCILLHDSYAPWKMHTALRIFHNLSAMLCFAFVVYVIQRYVAQRESLTKTVQKQRDDLLQDLELAAQVQRLFLPVGKPAMAGLEIAGMMRPARHVGGDYYDYIPIDAHTLDIVIADVSGKGLPAALLMSATAASVQLEANNDRDILQIVRRLNTGIRSVSDGEHYVTLLLAEIDAQKRTVRYVNCGHNPALLFQARTDTVSHMESSYPPVGLFRDDPREFGSVELCAGDVMVFYTDGVTEAENRVSEEFGLERLSAVLKIGATLSAENLMTRIYAAAAYFSQEVGFRDDVTILVVKCSFDCSSIANS